MVLLTLLLAVDVAASLRWVKLERGSSLLLDAELVVLDVEANGFIAATAAPEALPLSFFLRTNPLKSLTPCGAADGLSGCC